MIIILIVAFTVRAAPSSPRQGSSFPDLARPFALRIVWSPPCFDRGHKDQYGEDQLSKLSSEDDSSEDEPPLYAMDSGEKRPESLLLASAMEASESDTGDITGV